MTLEDIFDIWKDEIIPVTERGNAIYLLCFDHCGKVLYSNNKMRFIEQNPEIDYFINPPLEQILNNLSDRILFDGMITFGTMQSFDNFSIKGRFIRSQNKILMIGEIDIQELVNHIKVVRELNDENNNLNRSLIIEKNALRISEAKLIESEKNLLKVNATKDKFFSILAHDLINPLGSSKELLALMINSYNDFDENE